MTLDLYEKMSDKMTYEEMSDFIFNDFHKTESHCNTLIILIKENMLGLKMSFQTLFDLI